MAELPLLGRGRLNKFLADSSAPDDQKERVKRWVFDVLVVSAEALEGASTELSWDPSQPAAMWVPETDVAIVFAVKQTRGPIPDMTVVVLYRIDYVHEWMESGSS